MSYAPIAMFVYNRADHFEETFNALAKCPEAPESELFIFSDGAKSEAGQAKVDEVRNAVRKAAGSGAFKEVHIKENSVNRGLAESVISGVTSVIEKYGRIIVIEDDCVASPYLLKFMNRCLDFYEKDETVGAIAGFTPSINFPDGFNDDIFVAYRSCSWGWATWKRSWEGVDWKMKDIGEFFKNRKLIKRLNSNGNDRFIRLYRQSKKETGSWSIRFGAHLVKKGLLTVYPKYSYIRNIGCDASGVHSKEEDAVKMRVDLSKSIPDPEIKAVKIDKGIQKILKKHYSAGAVSNIKKAIATEAIILKHKLK